MHICILIYSTFSNSLFLIIFKIVITTTYTQTFSSISMCKFVYSDILHIIEMNEMIQVCTLQLLAMNKNTVEVTYIANHKASIGNEAADELAKLPSRK